jgi:hypothetical protein
MRDTSYILSGRKRSSIFLCESTRILFLAVFTFAALSVAAHGASMPLSLQDAPLSISKGSSVTKKITGIPFAVQGKIYFKVKWHAENLLPAYNRLTIKLLHGSTEMMTKTCYSVHSPEGDKCYFEFAVTQAESLKALDWKLVVTNGQSHHVTGFNIRKELTDVNPLVPNIQSIFVPSCVAQQLVLSGVDAFPVARASTVEQSMRIFSALPGTIRLRAKWHTEGAPFESREIFQQTYVDLKLTVLNENGATVKTESCFSIHSPKTPKCSFTVSVPRGTDTRHWKLRVENRHSVNLLGFNIWRELTDLNPLVPNFESTFTPTCN